MWPAQATVDSFRVEITSNPTLIRWVGGAETIGIFNRDDGVEDDTDYTATVTAVNEAGTTASNNSPMVTTNFFMWDEYYPTSLHFTRGGKPTFYNTTPNNGYETLTGVPYVQLPCQGCHRPNQAPGTKGCESCHDTADPQLGAQVDASLSGVCGGCHGRQAAERSHGFTDAHDTMSGGDCMFCHTAEDMHGDGTEYASMLEDGAIDARCSNCHTDVASVGGMYHSTHLSSVECRTCHMQSVVSCYNCHFEGQTAGRDDKFARTQIKNWTFLLNRNGKVHPANN